jgi:hypothetical protein
MKKTTKTERRLKLTSETVRLLREADLSNIVGGLRDSTMYSCGAVTCKCETVE